MRGPKKLPCSLSSVSLRGCEQNISARADAIYAHCSQPVARSFVFGKRQSASVVPNQQGADFWRAKTINIDCIGSSSSRGSDSGCVQTIINLLYMRAVCVCFNNRTFRHQQWLFIWLPFTALAAVVLDSFSIPKPRCQTNTHNSHRAHKLHIQSSLPRAYCLIQQLEICSNQATLDA